MLSSPIPWHSPEYTLYRVHAPSSRCALEIGGGNTEYVGRRHRQSACRQRLFAGLRAMTSGCCGLGRRSARRPPNDTQASAVLAGRAVGDFDWLCEADAGGEKVIELGPRAPPTRCVENLRYCMPGK